MKSRSILLVAAATTLGLTAVVTADFPTLTGTVKNTDIKPSNPFTGQGGSQHFPLGGHLILHNITADPTGWATLLATHGQVAYGGWDFDQDPDYGIEGFPGPLTSAGGGPVSAGNLSDDVAMFGQDPGDDLVGVGPGAGFGNPSNAVLANFFVDSFEIDVNWDGSGAKTAVEFDALSLLGSGFIDVYVDGVLLSSGVAAPTGGNRWGILDTSGAGFTHIELHDVADGAEGVQGLGITYIPSPGAIALLGLAGLVARRRRR